MTDAERHVCKLLGISEAVFELGRSARTPEQGLNALVHELGDATAARICAVLGISAATYRAGAPVSQTSAKPKTVFGPAILL